MAHSNIAAGRLHDLLIQLLWYMDLHQIRNTIAAVADKMHMGFNVAVEPLHAVDGTQADDLALLLEHTQVAVHSTQGQIGDLLLQVIVDHLCGGVVLGLPQKREDGRTLAEVLLGCFPCGLLSVSI